MTVETPEQMEGMRRVGAVVATVLRDMLDHAEPGMSTAELDAYGARRLTELGATSAPQATYDFPGATCISVNDAVAHGVPGTYVLTAGDMLNVDVSAELDGFWADNGASRVVGEANAEQEKLLDHAREARDRAISVIAPGVAFNQVARVFAAVARRGRYQLIQNLCSHGVGRSLHEPPRELSPVVNRRDRRKFSAGQTIAIEPFLTTGKGWVTTHDDGWTLLEEPGSMSAQFEHTILVTEEGAEILTVPID